MPKLFISYRRSDSIHVTGRIYDRLISQFGRDSVFKDVDSIPIGKDFRAVLDQAVAECDIFIVIIGECWLDATDSNGARRLDSESDFVRIEIESALRRDIPVIPVILAEGALPEPCDLPQSLQDLAYLNACFVRADPDFHRDLDRLVSGINSIAAEANGSRLVQALGAQELACEPELADEHEFEDDFDLADGSEVEKAEEIESSESRDSGGESMLGLIYMAFALAGGVYAAHYGYQQTESPQYKLAVGALCFVGGALVSFLVGAVITAPIETSIKLGKEGKVIEAIIVSLGSIVCPLSGIYLGYYGFQQAESTWLKIVYAVFAGGLGFLGTFVPIAFLSNELGRLFQRNRQKNDSDPTIDRD